MDTGDAGRVDRDGRLWLLGRADNAVGNLYPVEVERVVEALPWVSRAALVRVGSSPRTKALLAVQPLQWGSAGARAEQLQRLKRIARERDWSLDDVVLLRRLPVTRGAAAKVDDGRLRKLAATAGLPRSANPTQD